MIEIFGKETGIILGAVHFMPLVGYNGFTNYEEILETAKKDILAFEKGGVNGIILENNYNLPHNVKESKEVTERIPTEILKETGYREFLEKCCEFGDIAISEFRQFRDKYSETKSDE